MSYSGYACPNCGTFIIPGVQHKCGPHFQIQSSPINPFPYQPPPHGCICPPGANRECENPACPRKPAKPPSATGAA